MGVTPRSPSAARRAIMIAARNYARKNGASSASIISKRAACAGAALWNYLRSKPLTWPFHASCGYGFLWNACHFQSAYGLGTAAYVYGNFSTRASNNGSYWKCNCSSHSGPAFLPYSSASTRRSWNSYYNLYGYKEKSNPVSWDRRMTDWPSTGNVSCHVIKRCMRSALV